MKPPSFPANRADRRPAPSRRAGGPRSELVPLTLPRLARHILVVFALWLGASLAAQAANTFNDLDSAQLDSAAKNLQDIDTALQQPGLSKDILQKLQDESQPLALSLQRVLDHLTPRLAAQKAQLDQLGPPPGAEGRAGSAEQSPRSGSPGKRPSTISMR